MAYKRVALQIEKELHLIRKRQWKQSSNIKEAQLKISSLIQAWLVPLGVDRQEAKELIDR